ncbi:hypothetical protein [Paraburkholderia sp. HP33-1]|uniref:hypothetical protein n=1 Tax=Paraburkholderia sp. HP33-1 TaxID=2883243 RepID=UPI001F3C4830|nr:hypothetical protein [Paraburkholderia sp. HP33-1]
MQPNKIEIFDSFIEISCDKVNTNSIHKEFNSLTREQVNLLESNFYTRFANLDELYEKSDELAYDVLRKAIDQAMKSLATHEIYEIAEKQFLSRFVEPYATWEEDFEPIAAQYEAIVENTAELDAHRTARRQNRRQWVGFNQEAVYQADAKNVISNVGHGVFNLMAKGVTAIGNSVKKDEIFKSRKTVSQIINGVTNIINAAFLGTIDAINSVKPGTVYAYSAEEISKSKALVESVENGRIPMEKIPLNLIHAINFYPYSQKIYTLLFQNCGGDKGRLDAIITYFGMKNLDAEKRKLFENKLKELNASTVFEFQANVAALQQYADTIEYSDYESVLNKALEIVKENDFNNEVKKYPLQTLAECDQNLPLLEDYCTQIGYNKFRDWSSNIRRKIEAVHEQEEIKKQKAEALAKKSKFMQFLLSDDPSTKKKRGALSLVLFAILFVLWHRNS